MDWDLLLIPPMDTGSALLPPTYLDFGYKTKKVYLLRTQGFHMVSLC